MALLLAGTVMAPMLVMSTPGQNPSTFAVHDPYSIYFTKNVGKIYLEKGYNFLHLQGSNLVLVKNVKNHKPTAYMILLLLPALAEHESYIKRSPYCGKVATTYLQYVNIRVVK